MSKLDNIQTVYFLGIGGIGMSALARYFSLHGCEVSGYDKTKTQLTSDLESEGIAIHYTPSPDTIPMNADLVVYTPAIPQNHSEWEVVRSLNVPLLKRAEVLGLISDSGKCLAIAGTHGKTTTSAILAHVFKSAFSEVNAFVGGILTNYDTNFLYGADSDYYVVEADEFDRSFLFLTPQIAVVNSVDADHLDIYGEHDSLVDSFKEFANRVKPNGHLIVNHAIKSHFENATNSVLTFGIDSHADYNAINVRVEQGRFVFDLEHPKGRIDGLSLSLPGKHNIENAIAASAVALIEGVESVRLRDALDSFNGVKRRFEISGKYDSSIYVDDYAHHPTEISKVLEAAREMYIGRKLTVIFQPHLYSRTRDFEDDFAAALSGFDEVILLDIYPARELPIEGITSENLLKKITVSNKQVMHKESVVDYVSKNEFEVLFTLGAGDIDTIVQPIKELITA